MLGYLLDPDTPRQLPTRPDCHSHLLEGYVRAMLLLGDPQSSRYRAQGVEG